ncbi:TVP38/TMEM64 family protein [Paenibacillus sp. BAC0078]
MRKWLTIVLYIFGIILAFIYRSDILAWLREDHNLFLGITAATLVALFPAVPYKLIIGLYGYAYGSLAGAAICWSASTLAAAIMYGIVKYMFHKQGENNKEAVGRKRGTSLYLDKASAYLASVPALDKFTVAVRRRPFASVVLARLAPFIPQAAVNIYAGAASLPFWSYLAASGLGKIPGIALYAFLGGQMFQHPRSAVIAILVYVAVIGLAALSLRPGFLIPKKD